MTDHYLPESPLGFPDYEQVDVEALSVGDDVYVVYDSHRGGLLSRTGQVTEVDKQEDQHEVTVEESDGRLTILVYREDSINERYQVFSDSHVRILEIGSLVTVYRP